MKPADCQELPAFVEFFIACNCKQQIKCINMPSVRIRHNKMLNQLKKL